LSSLFPRLYQLALNILSLVDSCINQSYNSWNLSNKRDLNNVEFDGFVFYDSCQSLFIWIIGILLFSCKLFRFLIVWELLIFSFAPCKMIWKVEIPQN